MAIDPDRGTFVQQEYRYEIADAPEVKEVQPNARVIKLDTNLDLAAAQALADQILSEYKHVAQAFSIKLQGVDICSDDKLIGSPPTFLADFYEWPTDLTTLLRLVSVSIDYGSFTTTILVKGPQ